MVSLLSILRNFAFAIFVLFTGVGVAAFIVNFNLQNLWSLSAFLYVFVPVMIAICYLKPHWVLLWNHRSATPEKIETIATEVIVTGIGLILAASALLYIERKSLAAIFIGSMVIAQLFKSPARFIINKRINRK